MSTPYGSMFRGSRALWRLTLLLLITGLSTRIGADDSVLSVPWPDPPGQNPAVAPWARPLHGGAVGVLAVVPAFTQTDLAGLAARLDLDLDVVPVWGRDAWTREDGAEALPDDVRQALDGDHDVLLFANVVLDTLDADAVARIRARVEAGAGLVLISAEAATDSPMAGLLGDAVEDRPASEVLRALAESLTRFPSQLEARTLGSGRVCVLNWGLPPAAQSVLPRIEDDGFVTIESRESDYALVAECLVWAAGRQPSQQIRSVNTPGRRIPDADSLPPGLSQDEIDALLSEVFTPPTDAVQIELAEPAEPRDTLRVGVRVPEYRTRTIYAPETPPRGARLVAVDVPALPRTGFIDVWLERRGEVIDWHTVPLTASGPAPLALSLGQEAVGAHAGLGVSLEKQSATAKGLTEAVFHVTDAWGRVVAQERAAWPADSPVLKGELNLYDLLAPQAAVEVYVLPTTPQTVQRVAVRAPRRDQGFMMAARGLLTTEYVPRQHHDLLRRHGVQALLVVPGGAAPAYVADSGLVPALEFTPGFLSAAGGTGGNDPVARVDAATDSLTIALREAAPFGPVTAAVTLEAGNDPSMEALGEDPGWLGGFRAHLRASYGRLDALNAAWGAGFAAWDDVVPPDFDVEGAGGASFAPWLDTRMFLRQREREAAVAVRGIVARADAEGRSGIAAAEALPAGFDLAAAASELDVFFLPPGLEYMARYRSSAGQGTTALVACTADGGLDPANFGWWCWYAATNGLAGVWMPYPYATATPEAPPFAVSAGGLPTTGLVSLSGAAGRMREGLGDLYRRATPEAPRVVLYVSPASEILDELNPIFDQGASMDAWIEALHGLRLPFRTVSGAEALRGGLDGCEAVLLPSARALSAAECARLAAFHAGGGLLVAGMLPGQFDEHGVLRTESPLAGLFNVSQQGPPVPTAIADAQARVTADSAPLTLGPVTTDASVVVRDAAAASDAPVLWVANTAKSGAALLLNHGVTTSHADVLRRGLGAFWEANGRALGLPGVEIDAGAEIWAWRHTLGGAEVLTLLRHPGAGKQAGRVQVRFAQAGNLYAPAESVLVRGGQRAVVRLERGEGALLVRLPYRLDEVVLTVPEAVILGERLPYAVEIKAHDALPGDHPVHVTVRPIGGAVIDAYGQTVICAAGKGGGFAPLALSDPEAFYRVTARDLLTGATAEATVKVARRPTVSTQRSRSGGRR